ncbi:hypothetical protein DL98DRAFT_537322 [Cadophora sp. DSE1049]|nr:hypothetical protein DL98DRAFT_537322 [Cadophora sp. DSE1049]
MTASRNPTLEAKPLPFYRSQVLSISILPTGTDYRMSYEGVVESIPLQYRPVSSVTVDGIDSSNRSILDQEAGLNNSPNSRPIRAAGRRKTEFLYRQGAYSAVTDEENEGEDEAKATPVAEFFQKMIRFSVVTRFALYIIPVAVVLAIPIVLMATAFKEYQMLRTTVN